MLGLLLARSSPAEAILFLERAVAEDPSDEDAAEVLAELRRPLAQPLPADGGAPALTDRG